MAFGKEWIEVTEWNTLMRRYWDMDFERDLELQEAHTRSLPKNFKPNTLKFLLVFPREIHVTSDAWKDEDGTHLTGITHLSDEKIDSVNEAMRRFKRVVEAYTEGAITITFDQVILEKPLRFHSPTAAKHFSYAPCKNETEDIHSPFSARDDLADQLREQEAEGFDYLFLFHGPAFIDQKRKIGAGPHNAWTGWWVAGARPTTIIVSGTNPKIRGTKPKARGQKGIPVSTGVLIHEWQHHSFDRAGFDEDFILAHVHVAGALGYQGGQFRNGYVVYYTDRLRFFRPRDMWLKIDPHVIQDWPRQAFTGKEYD